MWLPKPTDSRKAVGNSDNQLSYAYPRMYIYIYMCVWGGAGGRRTEVAAAINSLCFYWRLFSYIIQSYH